MVEKNEYISWNLIFRTLKTPRGTKLKKLGYKYFTRDFPYTGSSKSVKNRGLKKYGTRNVCIL